MHLQHNGRHMRLGQVVLFGAARMQNAFVILGVIHEEKNHLFIFSKIMQRHF